MKSTGWVGVLLVLAGTVTMLDPVAAQTPGITDSAANALATACSRVVPESPPAADIIVTPLGQILFLRRRLHEFESVSVAVVADRSLAPALIVRRDSDFRSHDERRILGESQAGTESASRCRPSVFVLNNFGGPQGKVVIAAMTYNKGEVSLGHFDFPVARLYAGSFGLGPAWTRISDESYILYRAHNSTLSPGDSTIVAADSGTSRLRWVLTYTFYLLGPRDLMATSWGLTAHNRNELYRHLNPTVGVAPDALGTNAFVGVSFDFLPVPVVITSGVQFARHTVLDPGSHLAVGDTVSGDRAGLPLVNRWTRGFFLGVTLDFNAMLQVFTLAAKTGLGKG